MSWGCLLGRHKYKVDKLMINGTLWRFCAVCGNRQNVDPKTGEWRNA